MHRITATLLSMVAAFALVAGTARAETLSPESVPGATTIDVSKAKEVFD